MAPRSAARVQVKPHASREGAAPREAPTAACAASLSEIQLAFARALLTDEAGAPGGDARALLCAIARDGLEPAARLAVYRHHVAATLCDALKAAYPVVCRLVDERFFAFAAHGFIAAHPPASPCLFEFGALFPDFLAGFEPCRHLAYLPDVARLEWAMTRALHADDATPLDPRALGALGPDEVGGAVFRLDPSLTLLRAPWPVDRIWRANQPGDDPPRVIELGDGDVCLEVRRVDDEVVFRTLPEPVYVLRRALLDGGTLAAAAEGALGCDPALDLGAAIRDLLDDEVLCAITLTNPDHALSALTLTHPMEDPS
jgi:hypothetical protein